MHWVTFQLAGGPYDGQQLIREVDSLPPTSVPTYGYGIDCGDWIGPAPKTDSYVPELDSHGRHQLTPAGAWMFIHQD
jgi:hypothetical protein